MNSMGTAWEDTELGGEPFQLRMQVSREGPKKTGRKRGSTLADREQEILALWQTYGDQLTAEIIADKLSEGRYPTGR